MIQKTNILLVFVLATSLFIGACAQGGGSAGSASIGPDGDFSAAIPKAVLENKPGLALTAKLFIDEGTPNARIVPLEIENEEISGTVGNLSTEPHTFTVKYFLGSEPGELFATSATITEEVVADRPTSIRFPIEGLNQSPSATVRFPTKKSLTNGETLTITGTASDDKNAIEVITVLVDGIPLDADKVQGTTVWKADVNLKPGKNIITVKTEDQSGHINPKAETVEVTRSELLIDPKQVALDIDNNRAYVVDDSLNAILKVHLTTGVRTIVSDASHGVGIDFRSPMGIALDAIGGDLYVTDNGWKAIIKVDLTNAETFGNRDIVSGGISTSKGTGAELVSPMSVAIHKGNAYVVDRGLKALVLISLASGNRTISSGCPNSILACPRLGSQGNGDDFENPFGLVLNIDDTDSRAFVTDLGRDALIEVNLRSGSGDRTTKAVGFNNPLGVVLDLVRNRALVANSGDKKILSVDLDNGAVTAFSDGSTGSGPSFIKPLGLALDLIKKRVVATDNGLNSLFTLELTNGNRSIISDGATGSAENFFSGLSGVALDEVNKRVYVIADGSKGLLSVDLSKGNRSIVSDDNNGGGDSFVTPRGIALDLANQLAFIIDDGLDALLSIKLAEGPTKGDRTIVSDVNKGAGPVFNIPLGIALDLKNSKAFVIDDGLDALLSVNLAEGVTEGDRTVVSDNNNPFTQFMNPRGLDVQNQNLAFVIDDGRDELLSVDLSSENGNREPASNGPSGPALINPLGVAVNPTGSRAYIIDEGLKALLSVDLVDGGLTKGDRTLISDAATGVGTAFIHPSGIALDIENNRAFVIDTGLNALSLVELGSGDRVIISR